MKKFTKIVCILLVVASFAVASFALAACDNTNKVKIGFQSGTTAQFYVNGSVGWGFEGFSNVEATPYSSAALAVQDMVNGNLAYVITDKQPAKAIVASNSAVKMIDIALTSEKYGFGVDKSNSTLLTQINTWINANGTAINSIIAKYDDTNATIDGITSAVKDDSKAATQLVVATNAEFAPFEYKIGDKYAGIDIEIMKAFADANSYELVIENMDFDSVVTAIGKNNVDIGAAALTINNERAEVINFSDPYYNDEAGSDAAQVVICLATCTDFDACATKADVEAVIKSK